MRHEKSLLAAVVVLAGLATSAPAQGFGVVAGGGNAFAGGFGNGFGFNPGFTGYNNFGLSNGGLYTGGFYPGVSNNYGISNGGVGNYVPRHIPQTRNNMFGLMNSIRSQTGGGNSYRSGYGPAVGGRRR